MTFVLEREFERKGGLRAHGSTYDSEGRPRRYIRSGGEIIVYISTWRKASLLLFADDSVQVAKEFIKPATILYVMAMTRVEAKISATISGSFNKHLDQIQKKILEFQQEGIEVLSPELSRPISCKGNFVRLETDKGTPGEIESRHLEAISRSDFLYVVNPGGYIGKSVALEIGHALSRSIPIYSLEKPEDNVLSFFVKPEKSVKIIKRSLITNREEISFAKKSPTLTELQNYVRDIVKRRGFDKETIEDVLLLFVEEIGELARAIRDLKGLKVSRKSEDAYKNLKEELADCLIYLLDIANLANVDLEDALREKEKLNSARKWRSRKD